MSREIKSKSTRGGRRPGAGRPPGALNKATIEHKQEFAALARAMAPEMLTILRTIAKDTKASAPARVTAASAILDRGLGKPPQHLEHTGAGGAPLFAFFSALEAEDEAEVKGETLQ